MDTMFVVTHGLGEQIPFVGDFDTFEDKYFYVDVVGLCTVTIIVSAEGIIVDVLSLDDDLVATACAFKDELV